MITVAVVARASGTAPTSTVPMMYLQKMHGDLQKSAKDSTLEHSLFAAFNTD